MIQVSEEIKLESDIKIVDINLPVDYPGNAKRHSAKQIQVLKRLIKDNGFNVPLLLDKDNVIITGHGRRIAMKELGSTQITVIYKTELTELQKKKYRLGDNAVADIAVYDDSLLVEEYKKILEDTDMKDLVESTGISEQNILNTMEANELGSNDDAETVDKLGHLQITCPFCKKSFKKTEALK